MSKMESRGYRDELAGKLHEIRNSDEEKPELGRAKAQGYLEAKQETNEYKNAKDIHILYERERSNLTEEEFQQRVKREELRQKLDVLEIGEFREGVARVKDKDGHYYFIDQNGKEVFQGRRFQESGEISEGVVWVRNIGEKDYYYNSLDGEGTLNERFEEPGDFIGGGAWVRMRGIDGYVLINRSGYITRRVAHG
jgi:hypothetical protein